MTTSSLVAVAQSLKQICLDNQSAWDVADVFYGDQRKIPRTPTICVDTGTKQKELAGVSRKVDYTFTVFVMVYHSKVQSAQTTRLEDDTLSETVEAALELDPQLGGLLTHGYVTTIEDGYAVRDGTLLRTSRITYTGTATGILPASPTLP